MLVLFFIAKAEAQQDPNYTMYRYNMNLINPAYAGADGTTDLGITVRSQWANVPGAPETQSFIFGAPVGKNVGVGLSVINDRTFIEKQTSVAMDFSYHLKLNRDLDLYLGFKAGFNSYNANTDGLVTYGGMQDPKLTDLDGRFSPNFGAGAYLVHEDYFVSLSVPKILSPDRLEENDGIVTAGADKIHMYLSGGYNVVLSSSTILKPSVLVRYVEASPLSVDLTALLEFNKRFDLGAAYRINESVSGLVVFKVYDAMHIGYAYESPLESSIRNIDNGTHEIMMKLRL